MISKLIIIPLGFLSYILYLDKFSGEAKSDHTLTYPIILNLSRNNL